MLATDGEERVPMEGRHVPYRPVHSHLSSLSIPIGSENTTPLHGVADAL